MRALPTGQETQKWFGRNWFPFASLTIEHQTMNTRQQAAITPHCLTSQLRAQNFSARFQFDIDGIITRDRPQRFEATARQRQ